MRHRHVDRGRERSSFHDRIRGYSLVEILVVLVLVGVMTAISLPYLLDYTKKYKTENQAVLVMDLMREAGQLALNRMRAMRFEINGTITDRPVVRIVDENGTSGNPADDVVIKTVPLEPLVNVRMDVAPAGMTPPNPPNYPVAVYTGDVWTVKFTAAGSVVNAADVPVSATLYSWRPIMDTNTPFNISNLNPARPEETRAVTLYGGTWAVRYWKWTGTSWVASQ